MSSTTRITLALVIIVGSLLLMGVGIVRAVIVRNNLSIGLPVANADPSTPTPDPNMPSIISGNSEATPVFPPTPVPEGGVPPTPIPSQPTPVPTNSNPLTDLGNAYLLAVQREDWVTAFTLLDVTTTAVAGSPDGLKALMGGLDFNGLQAWQFTAQLVSPDGNTARLEGAFIRRDGATSALLLTLRRNGDQWRVEWFNNRL
jgi:hypothetical protein